MLDKLNTTENIYSTLPEVLGELCEHLNFGCGFYYQVKHGNQLIAKEIKALYPDHEVPKIIDLDNELVGYDFQELMKQKYIFRRGANTENENNICKNLPLLFKAKSIILVPIHDEVSEPIGFIGVSDRRGEARTEKDDVTFAYTIISTICNYLRLQIMKDRLDSTKNALQKVTDNMGVDIYVNDFYTHEILYCNSSMAEPYGGVDKMIGKICWEVLYDDKTDQCEYCPQKKIVDENGKPTKIYAWDYQRPFDGSWFKVLSSAFEWIDGRLAHIVSSIDITDNKKNEQIIQKMAMYDYLTDLPNRYKLTEDSDKMISNTKSKHNDCYLIFFDLDKFKLINDELGHQVGDNLLIRIAELLKDNEYIDNRCYRYGGDEFVILCNNNNRFALDDIIEYLKDMFTNPIIVDGQPLCCGASLGISHYPYDDTRTSELVRKADQAMYVSKCKDKPMIHFYNEGNIIAYDKYIKKTPLG